MAEEQELLQLELLCKQLYETADANLRTEAEKALVSFANSPDCLSKCQLLLERGNSPYAQLLAATTLTKLVSRPNVTLPLEQRIDIRNYVLGYLASRPKLVHYVLQALVQLFARITKLGWFDIQDKDYVFRNVITDVTKFIQSGSTQHVMIGVQLLSQLVCEMNQVSEEDDEREADSSRSLTKHRKIASSFRDLQLFEIFQLSCELLQTAAGNIKSMDFSDDSQHGLISHALRLAHNCLTFDFIGTSTDETADDLCTVQIPTGWRSAFLDGATMELFFSLYSSLPPSLSSIALSCLVQIASVRRSLFNNTERAKFLNELVTGVRNILENPQALSDPSNYHEFCRLLARLKTNYQLGELVKVTNYPELIKRIAEFTVTSLRQMWQFAPNSVHYLLSLWQKMVASMPYVKANEPHLLETYTPEIFKAYTMSRLESVTVVIKDGLEDPLEDQGMINQQLDQLSTIGRCEYEKTCGLLVQLFDEAAQRYQEAINSGTQGVEITIQEGRLSWLVYIIGAVIGGRISFASTDDHDAMDGELACRVLQLMNLVDSRIAQYACEKLDLAILSFFEQFRKIYVGDQVPKMSKVYRRLSEVLGLNDESMVLSVFIGKIITNLKYWARSEQITWKTLQLLNDLSVGYSSVRKLVKLDAVQFVLSNHTNEHFPFLGLNANNRSFADMRCRTTFYTALARLLMVDLKEDDEDKFEEFMVPLTSAFESVGTMLTNMDTPQKEEEAKRAVVGLARDLRGVAFAFNTKTSYMMFFDWIYPSYTPILHRAIEVWYHDPAVTTPVLKLMAELAQSRSQRLLFDVSSPNGYLLFREVSKVIDSYGSRILTIGEVPKDQVYTMKLKGISVCFSMLKAALCGNYVNFGVFRLYGDNALDKAFGMFVKLLLSVSQRDLMDYPKLSQNFYSLLECLANDHMAFISSLEPQVFLYILATISEGLTALAYKWSSIQDTMVCTGCCATLDTVITYLFKNLTIKKKKRNHMQQNEAFLRILELHPEILQQMLSTVLNIIMFEDCRNQWSMSRPLLGLILLNEEYFNKLRDSIIASQPPDKQQAMVQCFENLMSGIERSLHTKNRDKFTQNLSLFRRDVNDSLKAANGQSPTHCTQFLDMMS
ncbi:exportin-7 isoform X6 [Magallana gigas]|uniref:exportin-7 isoform X6 n=1 Tax=Magallana gigas TaxID=29159 RepID=UPI0033415C57